MTKSFTNSRCASLISHVWPTNPDIGELRQKRDIRGLTRLLQHQNCTIQWQAAEALGIMGPDAVDDLFRGLCEFDLIGRLGTIEALADIKDPRAVDPLINLLLRDEKNEIRWASALALGEIGDPRAIEALLQALTEQDKYVRFGSAVALRQLGWTPPHPHEEAVFLIALGEWGKIPSLGLPAADPVSRMVTDPDPDVRYSAVATLEKMHSVSVQPACDKALRDVDKKIRWKAVMAAKTCGIPFQYIPWSLSKRIRIRNNSAIAALLNFFFGGAGYGYLNLWWGNLVCQLYCTILLMFTLFPVNLVGTWTYFIYLTISGIPVPLPLSLILAAHARYITENMPDM